MSDIRELPLAQIITDAGTQFRVGLDTATVEDYAAEMKAGAVFPAVTVYADDGDDGDGNRFYLADGFHRIAAALRLERETFPAEVLPGGLRAAQLKALGANGGHGLRLTNDDKRKAVLFALRDPELRELSQREIARLCGVTQAAVSKINAEINPKVDNRYQQPEHIIADMKADDRAKFLKFMNSSHSGPDGRERKRYQKYGLIVTNGGVSEKTPMAFRIQEALSEDPFTALELELMKWGRAKNDYRYYVYDFGHVKPVVEKLYEAGGWVYENYIGGYEQEKWALLLVTKEYVQLHRVSVPEKRWDGSEYDKEYEFFHITKKGCELLGREAIQITPPPTREDVIASAKEKEEELERQRLARIAERRAQADPESEAAEERRLIRVNLNAARERIERAEWLTIDDTLISLIEQLAQAIEAAPVVAVEAPAAPEATPEPRSTNPALAFVYEQQAETGAWVPLLSIAHDHHLHLASALTAGHVSELIRTSPVSRTLVKWYAVSSAGAAALGKPALPELVEPPAGEFPAAALVAAGQGDERSI